MCLMAFAWKQGHHTLTLLGNRDEFHRRPTREALFWSAEGLPQLLAGQDMEAGGTWLGVTRQGRFAALTNVRAPGSPTGGRSRGRIVLDYLAGTADPGKYLQALAEKCADYAGFNVLVGDSEQLWYLNSAARVAQSLGPGVYGLSNASLDSPWPKLAVLKQGLANHVAAESELLLSLLEDPQQYPDELLPQTGVSLEWERLLSAAFIVGEDYGTRSSSLLRLHADGLVEFTERRFGPMGEPLGNSRWEWNSASESG